MNETLPVKPVGSKPQLVAEKKSSLVFAEGLQEYTGTWDTAQVVHLLKRTLFGARLTDVNYFKSRTMAEAVDEILRQEQAGFRHGR